MTDQTPRTKAGRRLDGMELFGLNEKGYYEADIQSAILAIETEARAEGIAAGARQIVAARAEARADALREAAERVRAIWVDKPPTRAAVLAILSETER